jgi:AraC-like DNA-binding protein
MRLVVPFREVSRALGVGDLNRWDEAGFKAVDAGSFDVRVPLELAELFLANVIARTGIADIGLRAAEAAEPGLFDIVEYAARSRPTLREALACTCRLFPILSDVGELTWEETGDVASIAIAYPAKRPHPAIVEFTLAYLLIAARRLTRRDDLAVEAVEFQHAAPSDRSRHRALFDGLLRFDAAHDRLVIARETLDLPLATADAHLGALLDRVADHLLAERQRDLSVAERVRRTIAARMGKGGASVKEVARSLGMTPRTLHRRLAEERLTFRELLHEVRRSLAIAHLKEPRLSVTEVAYLLGFSDVTSFHRAFRRWTGGTPRGWRARGLQS